ncbi:ParE-like toxin of type II ParDE toxin-antitoxin system [Collimonas sp. PA-H2]|uniref:type II toxin-antitoxin system RelE/ParE family toxin n=1 Tax=Collimonas sp. PA-H2 TaxID=1881062 RepID=UPI000BFA5AD7|nr:type II toxin-antitoxin system RelE/ParE family toxin [Collimonas sp. PA-H2]PFH08753.1 ParE-like toxin of type II ParDE toxin-antitoxin system [Collimonas sp. PA-H2]
MPYLPNYKKPFSAFVKKQHKPFQAVIEDETLRVCAKPDIGEAKSSDLTGIYVHKFKHKTQEYLMAYHVPAQKMGNKAEHRSPDFLFIDFYKLGTHENFYDDLKAYLRANGWYK